MLPLPRLGPLCERLLPSALPYGVEYQRGSPFRVPLALLANSSIKTRLGLRQSPATAQAPDAAPLGTARCRRRMSGQSHGLGPDAVLLSAQRDRLRRLRRNIRVGAY